MDSWARVDVPYAQWIMVSITMDILSTVNCVKERIALYKGNATSIGGEIFTVCDFKKCPVLVDTQYLHVHFVSGERTSGRVPKTGFRLDFSFHNQSALLHEVEFCKWNCSVAIWPDFRLHFPCNLMSQCVGHEDEAGCPYTSEACGAGLLSAGGSCFSFHSINHTVSWEEAARLCKEYGSRLASFNSPEKLKDVLKALDIRAKPFRIYIGLSTSSITLPHVSVLLFYHFVSLL